jgi:hypothetical protein
MTSGWPSGAVRHDWYFVASVSPAPEAPFRIRRPAKASRSVS